MVLPSKNPTIELQEAALCIGRAANPAESLKSRDDALRQLAIYDQDFVQKYLESFACHGVAEETLLDSAGESLWTIWTRKNYHDDTLIKEMVPRIKRSFARITGSTPDSTQSVEVRELLKRVESTTDFSDLDFSDVNTTNALGESALHCVVIWGDIDAVKLLIAAGLNINRHGEFGYTPLHYAAEWGHEEIVKILLEAGANPFLRTQGDTPASLAKLSSHDEIANLLRENMHGSPYRPDGWGFTLKKIPE